MLLGRDAFLVGHFALHDLRQAAFVFVFVVAAFFVNLQKAIEQHDLPGRAQAHLTICAGDINRGAFHAGGGHLAGDGALPDQIIQAALVHLGGAQLFGSEPHVGGADTFMRFLRVLGLVFVHARAVRQIGGPEAALDFIARSHHRLGCHVDAIGPHIGDVPRLVQTLCGVHALLGPHAELAAGLLLQRRCHEGRIGVAAGGFRLDRLHGQRARGDGLHRNFGGLGRGDVELAQLFAAKNGQAGLIILTARGRKQGADGPEFLRAKRLDLHLALDDQAQAHRLHAACRFRPRQLSPQHRRQGESHQIIQRAAGQIRLDQRAIDLTRVLHRLGHGGLGDGVKRDAADLFALFQGRGQRLLQVPGNRLAFAVRVGRKDQLVIGLQRLGNRANVFLAVGGNFPSHREIMLRVDRTVFWRQIADMAVRGKNRIVGAKIFVDCLGLGR